MEKLRILAMNWRDVTHPWAGGAELFIHEVMKRLARWGHEVVLLCGCYRGCRRDDEIEGVRIIRAGGPYTVYLYAVREYLSSLRKMDYDVVVDSINGVPFFTPLYVRKPVVAVMHHLVRDIFFKELPMPLALIGYLSERSIPMIYRDALFIAVSEGTMRDLMDLGIPRNRVKIVYNGIDRDKYKPGLAPKSPYPHIVYLGRIKRYKNVDHILRAIKLIVNEKNIRNIKLTIAGRGDHEPLRRLAGELGVARYVEFLGEVSEDEKIRLLNRAWIYVTASHREGWGIAVIEANACGAPAVAYDVPGLRDSIKHMDTGILVPYGDIKALAEAIAELVTNHELREKLSRNAIEHAGKFSWDDTARSFLNVLMEALNRGLSTDTG